MKYHAYPNKVLVFLENFLTQQITDESLTWLINIKKLCSLEIPDQLCITTFSTIPRYFDKKILSSDLINIDSENTLPKNWSLTQIARAFFILLLAQHQPENLKRILDKLFFCAGQEELIALYQMLFLLPDPMQFCERAIEGVRSNMATVFNAVALNNSYPANFFNQNAWNQLVLKALFIDSEIQQIIGLKERANPVLAQMLSDYAKERSSAGRFVKTELWQIVEMCSNYS